jgi:adenylosuccinate lyase
VITSELGAISPLDGRYCGVLASVAEGWSEAALIRARIRVELQWVRFLYLHVPALFRGQSFDPDALLSNVYESETALSRVKEIEGETGHDVKAVEYFLREALGRDGYPSQVLALIHFGLTSEDVNNLAYGTLLSQFRTDQLLPTMDRVIAVLTEKAGLYKDCAMNSRTHGQAASPTTMGKALTVYAHRLQRQREQLAKLEILGKLNGAVGDYHGLAISVPEENWRELAHHFISDTLGLTQNPWTTQIESHDNLIEHLDVLKRYNGISLDLCQNLWWYISFGYFGQEMKETEVGSSIMPHKVNPIDFENAEGNFGLSSGLIEHMGRKLPVSRLQRDLSDSTTLRNLGTVFAHHTLAQLSLLKGLSKLLLHASIMTEELENKWEVLGEALQTCLRREGVLDAYERVKAWTRGKGPITQLEFQGWIHSCKELPAETQARLLGLTPARYTGEAAQLVDDFLQQSATYKGGSTPITGK